MLAKLCFLFISLVAAESSPTKEEDLSQINQEITELRGLYEKYQSSATRNTNNAMRWQFQNENYLDARRAWDRAAQDKEAMNKIQKKIDQLEEKKAALSQDNGIK